YPAVFHCAAGKDRTGIVACVVLGLLGVSDDEIVADYALSGPAMARMIEWFEEMNPGLEWPSTSPMLTGAPAQAMGAFLEIVRRDFGSFVGLASWLGLAPETVEGLQRVLLD